MKRSIINTIPGIALLVLAPAYSIAADTGLRTVISGNDTFRLELPVRLSNQLEIAPRAEFGMESTNSTTLSSLEVGSGVYLPFALAEDFTLYAGGVMALEYRNYSTVDGESTDTENSTVLLDISPNLRAEYQLTQHISVGAGAYTKFSFGSSHDSGVFLFHLVHPEVYMTAWF